eukprot:g21263.t1
MAQVDYDRIYLRDDDGNHFEVKGDQSLDFKLSVSMGDDFASPRCVCPQKPFKHPDASFLPLPEQAPQPRLFIVYGDGEAEELLVRRDFEEEEGSGWDRIMHMDPVNVPMRPLELPHGICGFVEPPPSPLKRTFTEFRQFIEYPELTEQKLQEFESAYEVYLQQEEEQRTLHSTLGQGLQNAQRGSMQKTSTLDPSKFREAASSEPGEASTSDLAREGGA